MKIKLTNFFFLIFIAMKCITQEKPVTIYGKVNNIHETISDVHIISKYYNKKLLEGIQIFQEESTNYNAIKN